MERSISFAVDSGYYAWFAEKLRVGSVRDGRVWLTPDEHEAINAEARAYCKARRDVAREKWREMYPGAHLPSAEDAVRAGALCRACEQCAPLPGKRCCASCRAEHAAKHKRRYDARRQSGRCVFHGNRAAVPGRTSCAECLARMRKTRDTVYAGRKRDERCMRCGGLRELGAYCRPCAAIQREHTEKRHRLVAVSEPIDKLAVFERDGWRCQICGKKTDRKRMGSAHDRAPELDHRIPISRGGAHTYENVQCSCHACNSAKGNRSEAGQIPLWSRPAA